MEPISAAAFKSRLDSGETLQILDIRTPYEWEDFNLGGLSFPFEEVLLRMDEVPPEFLENETIVLCGTGLQSAIAVRLLTKRGFKNLRNLEGGLEAYLSL